VRRVSSQLSYANVMSTIAVVLALGGATAIAASSLAKNSVGTKQLKKNAVTGAKVKNGSLTGDDIKAATLGRVPAAVRADSAGSSERAASAARADTATNVAEPEAEHFVGAPGEPVFAIGWQNVSSERAAFYRDREGVVHLQGKVQRTAGTLTTIFILPQTYLPKDDHEFIVASDVPGVELLVSSSNGTVDVLNFQNQTNKAVSLDGVTWRAGH
jgi:hypothetical protein